MALTEPIKNKEHLKQIASYFLEHRQYRNHLLLVFGAHTALRISDILRLKWKDVCDANGRYFTHISIKERKTGKTKIIALHKEIIKALRLYRPHMRGEFLFAGNRKNLAAISRIQAWRILRSATLALGIDSRISPYSLRKSFGYWAWKSGVSPVILMDVYNHSTYDVTKRYLGIHQDEIDQAYLSAVFF